eukprot:437860-Heterocapsa_arctica.AAC.1
MAKHGIRPRHCVGCICTPLCNNQQLRRMRWAGVTRRARALRPVALTSHKTTDHQAMRPPATAGHLRRPT